MCTTLRAEDLTAWFGWPVRGDVRTAGPARCTVRLGGGQRATITSGTAAALAARLDSFATSGTALAGFDPTDPRTGVVSYRAGHTIGVATDGVQIVITDVRAGANLVPSLPRPGTAAFLSERMRPVGVAERAEALSALTSLEPAELDGCWNLDATSASGDVVAEITPASIAFADGNRSRGRLEVGDGLVGQVVFGRDPEAACRRPGDSSTAVTSAWPLIAGRARYQVRPAAGRDRCLDVTLELSGLVVERPDDGREPLPDVTVRNRSFGSGLLDGCLYPAG